MTGHRCGSHTVSRLTAHLVSISKYRYDVLEGDLQPRCRELVIQGYDAEVLDETISAYGGGDC